MAGIANGSTVEVRRRADCLTLRENPIVTTFGKIAGGLGALAFLAAATLFWVMDVAEPESSVIWLRIVLCGGLAAIGIILGWSALSPRKSVSQLEMDASARALRIGKVTRDGKYTIKHTVAFSDIDQFFAGSKGDVSEHGNSTTVLYFQGTGGPRNGALIVGSVYEIEEAAQTLQRMLKAPPKMPERRIKPRSTGFGRRGT